MGGDARPLGNPTEGALLAWLEDQGIDYIRHRGNFTVDDQWTFSTERKFMGTLGASPVTGTSILHVKGAPGMILGRCSHVLTDEGVRGLDEHRATIEDALISYQARGMRTIGFAYREAPNAYQGSDIEEIANDMTWLGFAAIADPVRPGGARGGPGLSRCWHYGQGCNWGQSRNGSRDRPSDRPLGRE